MVSVALPLARRGALGKVAHPYPEAAARRGFCRLLVVVALDLGVNL